jgi:hypothetical protein
MQYWSPNREISDQDWPEVLREFIPRIELARSSDAYQLAMMAVIAKANDTHTNLWSSIRLRPPTGNCQFPVNVRFFNDQAVVASYVAPEAETDQDSCQGILWNRSNLHTTPLNKPSPNIQPA